MTERSNLKVIRDINDDLETVAVPSKILVKKGRGLDKFGPHIVDMYRKSL